MSYTVLFKDGFDPSNGMVLSEEVEDTPHQGHIRLIYNVVGFIGVVAGIAGPMRAGLCGMLYMAS